MLDSLTFIVLVFHFCPIYFKKIWNPFTTHGTWTKKTKKKKSKKRYRERVGRKKERRRRKKKKKKESRESSLVHDYGHMVVIDFFFFFFFSYLFMPAEISIPTEIGRNWPEWPKLKNADSLFWKCILENAKCIIENAFARMYFAENSVFGKILKLFIRSDYAERNCVWLIF